MLEQHGNALGAESLDFEKFQGGGRILLQPVIAALAGTSLDDVGEHGGEALSDTCDFGNLAGGVFHNVVHALRVAFDCAGAVAVAADAEAVLARDLHEIGGFVQGTGDLFVFHDEANYILGDVPRFVSSYYLHMTRRSVL